jgi:hypothetical protein
MGLETEAKAGAQAVKKNWLFFLLLAFAVVVLVLWYDHKKAGALTAKLAGLPGIGKLFACLALIAGGFSLLARLAA